MGAFKSVTFQFLDWQVGVLSAVLPPLPDMELKTCSDFKIRLMERKQYPTGHVETKICCKSSLEVSCRCQTVLKIILLIKFLLNFSFVYFSEQGQRDFFDNLHLSPLKVHVSFSLTSYDSSKKSALSQRSNFLTWFLQSLGVTITDTDDIVFRLAYFERKHSFYSVEVKMSPLS